MKQAAANDERERERQGMKEITRKQFMGGMTATVALSWRGAFAAPARMQRGYADTTWWDPYVENITDTDTYLRRKFRHDVTDKTTGVGVEALKKILAEIVAAGNGSPDGAGAGVASVQLYGGRALVIVRRAGGSGLPLKLTATAAGVRPESVVIPRK